MELLYVYGGVYLDTDFEAFGQLDTWVENVPGAVCNENPIHDIHTQPSISNVFFAIGKQHNLVRRALVHLQSPSRLNTFWINQETGPFFSRNTLGKDLGTLRIIPSRILFPVPFSERQKLVTWNCYERGPCTSAMLNVDKNVVAAHLWNRDGPGWAATNDDNAGTPIIDSLIDAITRHNSRLL